jgi:hypothetical protein
LPPTTALFSNTAQRAAPPSLGIDAYSLGRQGAVQSQHMATVRFTQNIQRHVSCPPREITGGTLRAVMDGYFQGNPQARGYVLDDRGGVRQHMVIFIDGELVKDRANLSDPVRPDAAIDVIQALSGG